jgi:two-component system chemotaxis sensor kinase CheA
VRNVSGASVLASGEVVPILNVPDLVASAERIRAVSKAKAKSDKDERQRRVLIAEDSITSRMLLKNILESAGYDVTTAVDGAEAFASLRSEDFDVLVSDVEMPRMDGFELTERVRADARLAQLPVILVTALGSREHREKGIDVGASAYIVKSSFDHSNLLETVERFL